jgi:octaprenyl-diphosphate synthase
MFSIIARQLSQVRSLIERELSDCGGAVRDLAEDFGRCRGKMIRPGLVLLSGLACGGITKEHIRAAAIIEMIHNATLFHDDVVDESAVRRGKPTLNSLRGNESAVLFGDYLLSRVFRLCMGLEREASETIAVSAVRTCEGELRQISQRGNGLLSEGEYIGIIGEKTAALFSAACSLGAMLAGAGRPKVKALADYGLKTGIAFQITDDLLDLTGDEKRTGKPTGSDADNGKMTLPVIHFLKSSRGKEKTEIIRQISSHRANGEKARAALVKKLASQGSIEYARRKAEDYVEQAIKSLNGLKDGAGKSALIETARFVSSRKI